MSGSTVISPAGSALVAGRRADVVQDLVAARDVARSVVAAYDARTRRIARRRQHVSADMHRNVETVERALKRKLTPDL
jgi:hypothetical protein